MATGGTKLQAPNAPTKQRTGKIPVNFTPPVAGHLAESTPTLLEGTRSSTGCLVMLPDKDDIVVRKKRGNPSAVYLLGTVAIPGQFHLPSREEAVSRAVAFAQQRRVRAWFNSDDTFVLLGTYCEED